MKAVFITEPGALLECPIVDGGVLHGGEVVAVDDVPATFLGEIGDDEIGRVAFAAEITAARKKRSRSPAAPPGPPRDSPVTLEEIERDVRADWRRDAPIGEKLKVLTGLRTAKELRAVEAEGDSTPPVTLVTSGSPQQPEDQIADRLRSEVDEELRKRLNDARPLVQAALMKLCATRNPWQRAHAQPQGSDEFEALALFARTIDRLFLAGNQLDFDIRASHDAQSPCACAFCQAFLPRCKCYECGRKK